MPETIAQYKTAVTQVNHLNKVSFMLIMWLVVGAWVAAANFTVSIIGAISLLVGPDGRFGVLVTSALIIGALAFGVSQINPGTERTFAALALTAIAIGVAISQWPVMYYLYNFTSRQAWMSLLLISIGTIGAYVKLPPLRNPAPYIVGTTVGTIGAGVVVYVVKLTGLVDVPVAAWSTLLLYLTHYLTLLHGTWATQHDRTLDRAVRRAVPLGVLYLIAFAINLPA